MSTITIIILFTMLFSEDKYSEFSASAEGL